MSDTTVLVVSETTQVLEVSSSRDSAFFWGRQLLDGTPADGDVWAWIAANSRYELKQIDELAGGFVNVTGDTMTGDLNMTTSDILPTTDNTGNLGLTAKRWTSIWGYAATITNTLTAATGTFTNVDGILGGNTPAALSATTGGFSGALTASGGVDGVLGGVTPAAVTATTLNATGGGALTGTWSDLGAVTTVDINGGTIGGVTLDGTISGTPTWASNQAITLSTAAQPNVTSLGTLTALQVDNLNLNGNTLSATIGAVNITPVAGSAIVLDGTISVDAGVVTGATSITSTNFVGALDGVVGGVTPAAGTFTALNATSLGITGTLTTQHVVSQTDNTYDLGASGNYYAKAWVNSLEASGIGTIVGDWRFTTGTIAYGVAARMEDDATLLYGNGSDYWSVYNATGTAYELWTTNANGAGADGLIYSVQDGTDDILFAGVVTATGGLDNTAVGGGTPAAGAFTTIAGSGVATVGGVLSVDDTTEATSTTAASLQTDGGIACVKAIIAGGLIQGDAVTVPGALTGSNFVVSHATAPRFFFKETGAAVDNKNWDILVFSETLEHRVYNDADSVGQAYLRINRTGTTVDSVDFPQGAFSVTGVSTLTGNVGIGAASSANADLKLEAGRLMLKESATPTADAGYAKLYSKTDNNLYFQDGAGVEHIVSATAYKSYAIGDPGTSDDHYLAGFYEAPAADVTLTIGGSVTQTLGTVGNMKAAHAFCVASAAGGTDLVLTVSGTSITDAGVATGADSEVIVADTDTATTDAYYETSKKWLGQVTYTLTGAAGAFTFNYGWAKYEDFGNRDFTVTDLEAVLVANASIADFDLRLLLHSSAGWTYSAAAFSPGGTVIASSLTDQGAGFDNSSADENFAYKRAGLAQSVSGSASEGVVIDIHASVNNAFEFGSVHIGVTL